jgi:hypothetical protein
MLFFPARSTPPRGLPGPDIKYPQAIGYSDPMFVGLGNARVDDLRTDNDRHYLVGLTKTGAPGDINLDYYQHPDKRCNPTLRYSRSYDIYSLGCLLLEIGYWKPIHLLVDVRVSPHEMKSLLRSLAERLDG